MKRSIYWVLGLGKTGRSIAGYLQRRQLPFAVYDTRIEVEGLTEFKRDFPEVDVFLQDLPPEQDISQAQAMIASPGLALDAEIVQRALAHGVPVYGDIECLAREIKAPVVAITGTNGKSTVTLLVGAMAQAAGYKTAIAGNIGEPVLNVMDDAQHYDLWVLELSSFQLELTHSLKPLGACILNISPDHLDRHHDWPSYVAAKHRIYSQAKTIVSNRMDAVTQADTVVHKSAIMNSFGLDEPKGAEWGLRTLNGRTFISKGAHDIMPVEDMKLKGLHNYQNVLAACALAEAAGIPLQCMEQTLKTFTGLPHRCQWVRTLDGVDWIDDSKGTNVGATLAAISGLGPCIQGKIILIAGGLGKGADFSDLRGAVEQHVKCLVLIGQDANLLEKALSDKTRIQQASSMHEAVDLARAQATPGDMVLLSPACASFDMFKDFNHRGEVFTDLVNQL